MKIKVICLECSAKFSTSSMVPECPRCGGSDIEPRMEAVRMVCRNTAAGLEAR